MQIEVTTDYDKFKKSKGNRPIKVTHLEKLVESMRKNNFLPLRPIIVSPDFEVIDGQHRLEAAKVLGLPVFYGVVTTSAGETMATLNANQKGWTIENWVAYWASTGNENYIKLLETANTLGRSCHDIVRLIKGRHNPTIAIKEGTFKITSESALTRFVADQVKVNEVADLVFNLSLKKAIYVYTGKFRQALSSLFKVNEFDYEYFKERLIRKMDVMRPCTTAEAYKELFVDIYNYARKDRLVYNHQQQIRSAQE